MIVFGVGSDHFEPAALLPPALSFANDALSTFRIASFAVDSVADFSYFERIMGTPLCMQAFNFNLPCVSARDHQTKGEAAPAPLLSWYMSPQQVNQDKSRRLTELNCPSYITNAEGCLETIT